MSNLVTSDKKFLHEASDLLLIRNDNGDKVAGMTYLLPNRLANASEYGKDSNSGNEYRPKPGYDGHVVIHPDAVFIEYDTCYSGIKIEVSRASLVFHELAENYERTNNNIDYNGLSGAHKLAIEREKGWLLRGSLNPGEGGLTEGGLCQRVILNGRGRNWKSPMI